MMTEPMTGLVRCDISSGIATIELANPVSGNAINLHTAIALNSATSWVSSQAEQGLVRVAVLRAQGSRFCVGGDLQEFNDADDPRSHITEVAQHMHEAVSTMARLPVPVVALVQGVAAGGGVGLALCADLVVASTAASFRAAYGGVGLSPDCGTSWIVTSRLGQARAMDFFLTNGAMDAAAAHECGLVSRVVAPNDLQTTLETVTNALLAGAPDANAATKALVRRAGAQPLVEHLNDEARSIALLAAGSEARRRIADFAGRTKQKSPINSGRTQGAPA